MINLERMKTIIMRSTQPKNATITDIHHESRVIDFNLDNVEDRITSDTLKSEIRDHVNNFENVLRDIKSKAEVINDPKIIDVDMKFCLKDCIDLVSCETSERVNFVNSIQKLPEYRINKLRRSADIFNNDKTDDSMIELRDIVHSNNFSKLTSDSKIYLDTDKFLRSEPFNNTVDKLSTHLLDKTHSDIDDFLFYTEHYEDVMLVIVEPSLSGILGCTLLLSIIVPLHKTGAFYHLISKVRHTLIYSYSYKRFIFTTIPTIKYYTTIAIKNPLLSMTLGLASVYSLKVLGSKFFMVKQSLIVQELVSKAFTDGGFNNESLNAFKEVLSKSSYEVGHIISTVTYSLAKGLLKKYETLFAEIAPYIDKYISNFRKK